MNEHIISIDNIKRFTNQCFDKDNDKVASIIKGILDGRSPRISDISNNMDGNPEANYKTIQRFLDKNDPRDNLHRLFNEDRRPNRDGKRTGKKDRVCWQNW